MAVSPNGYDSGDGPPPRDRTTRPHGSGDAVTAVFVRLGTWLRVQLERMRRKYAPRILRSILHAATVKARRHLTKGQAIRILVDNTVLGHAVTHETAWISKGVGRWGPHEFNAGYAARIPIHSADNDGEIYRNLTYLTGLTHLARTGHVSFCTSAELRDETFRQPQGRFSNGYGYFDYSLFSGISLECVDQLDGGWVIGPSYMRLPSLKEQQLARIDASEDPVFKAILKRLGEKQSLDAWHIATAERLGMHCFLTMDFKLMRSVERWKDYEPFRSMKTKVLTPEELGREWRITPVAPHLYGYNDASFPVRSDLHVPDEKRTRAGIYRKGKR